MKDYSKLSKEELIRVIEEMQANAKAEAKSKEAANQHDKNPKNLDLLNEIMDSVSDGFVSFDSNFNYTYVNSKGYKLLGRNSGELIGKNYFIEYPEAKGSPFSKAYLKAMVTQKPLVIEDYYEHWNRWFINRIYPSKGGINIFFSDITELKQIENKLKERNQFIETLINLSPTIVYIFDIAEKKNVYTNNGIETSLGYSTSEIAKMGNHVLSILMHPMDLLTYHNVTSQKYTTLKDNESVLYQFRMKHKNGSWLWLDCNEVIYMRNADGSPKQIFGVAYDITDLKLMEEAIQKQTIHLNEVLENSIDASYKRNLCTNKYEYLSPVFKKISGYTAEELNNMPLDKVIKLMHPDDMLEIISKITAATSKPAENPNQITYRFKHKTEDHYIWLLDKFTVMHNEQGEAVTLIGSVSDITESKLNEEKIRKLSRVNTVLENINQAIVRLRDKQSLFDEACRIAVEDGGFVMAWMGLHNAETNKIDVIASTGDIGDYLKLINIDLNDKALCSGPTGQAFITQKSVLSNDIANDKRMLPWKERALKYGFRSAIALPISLFGKIIGVYTLYSSEVDFFSLEEITLLNKMAENISFALEFIETENGLLASEEKYRTIFDNVQDVFYQVDLNGIIMDISPSIKYFSEYNRNELIGESVSTIHYYPDAREKFLNALKVSGELKDYELALKTKDGAIKHVSVNARLIFDEDGTPFRVDGALRDITERRIVQQELALTLEKLRQLHQHAEKMIEEERTAISREMHDSLGQMLTAVLMDLTSIKHHIKEPETILKITKIFELVGDTIKTVQKLTAQLRPANIDALGLKKALTIYINDFIQRFKIDIKLEMEDKIDINPDVSLVIYRIVLESLTNIARHSKATEVLIKLEKSKSFIIVTMTDNGIGISEKEINAKDSFGIISMKERAAALDGKFTIGKGEQGGTLSKLQLPTLS